MNAQRKYRDMKMLTLISCLLLGFSALGQTVEGTSNAVLVAVGNTDPMPLTKGPKEEITLETLGISHVPRYHALIIGVSDYQFAGAGLPNLDMPVRDATRLASILLDRYTFSPDDVTLLTNPTRETIINEFDRLAEGVSPRDNVLIFYAGHGVYDREKDFGFWLPSNAKMSSRSDWIANSTIKDYIGAIKSKHTLLITDACFGGSIFKTRSAEGIISRFVESYRNSSRRALTSGNLSEVPDQSVFLKYLIKGLEENEDVFLSTSVLFSRIYEPIVNNAIVIPQFGVIQGAGDEGGDFIFIKR